jgi:hypothetical protein
MATINNSDLMKEIVEDAKIQINTDKVPSQLAEKVVPVMEVNPKFFRKINVIARATSSSTIYTAPTNKDFFLTAYNMSGVSTATGEIRLTVTPKNQAAIIIGTIELGNTVAVDISSDNITQNFDRPILIERGSAITLASTGTQSLKQATIFGYTVEE